MAKIRRSTVKGAVHFPEYILDGDEPTRVLREVAPDILVLGGWSISFLDNGAGNMGRVARSSVLSDSAVDQAAEAFAKFWYQRDQRMFDLVQLKLGGTILNNPDFPEGIDVEVPVVSIERTTQGIAEITEYGSLTHHTKYVAHDLMVARTANGVELAFFSDEGIG